MSNLYRPLELSKLCANVIIDHIFHPKYEIFYETLIRLELPESINNIILERYDLICHITKIENPKN